VRRIIPMLVLGAVFLSGAQQVHGQGAPWRAEAQTGCSSAVITAYSVEQYPGRTADGTPTPGNAGVIAAASYNYALGTIVTVEGLGTYRVADRGHLGTNHIDVLMQTTREALQFGRQIRTVCQ
jgi:3D (Asp-Asp-Asp) domain-containing protein